MTLNTFMDHIPLLEARCTQINHCSRPTYLHVDGHFKHVYFAAVAHRMAFVWGASLLFPRGARAAEAKYL